MFDASTATRRKTDAKHFVVALKSYSNLFPQFCTRNIQTKFILRQQCEHLLNFWRQGHDLFFSVDEGDACDTVKTLMSQDIL
jgi:hypothetical protein